MRTSIWYRTEERNPDKTGHYLTYRGWGIAGKADTDNDHGYLWYSKERNEWYDYERAWDRKASFVYYWTDADPVDWVDYKDPPSIKIRKATQQPNVTLQAAWDDVEEAIRRYETIRILCDKS